MIINNRCTTCNEKITADETARCKTCGSKVHDRCATYELHFECPNCADDAAIGALEF